MALKRAGGHVCHPPTPQQAARLPELGDWGGPIYGEPGVLAVEPDGRRVQCHACGAYFVFLANHVWRTHQLSADEYRALFGLAAGHGLVSPTHSEMLRRRALRTLRPYCWYCPARVDTFSFGNVQ